MFVYEVVKGCSRVTLTQLNHPYTLLNMIQVSVKVMSSFLIIEQLFNKDLLFRLFDISVTQ